MRDEGQGRVEEEGRSEAGRSEVGRREAGRGAGERERMGEREGGGDNIWGWIHYLLE